MKFIKPSGVEIDVNEKKAANIKEAKRLGWVPKSEKTKEPTLLDLKKPELLEVAEKLGLEIPANTNKPEIIAAIEAKTAEGEE